MCQLRATDSRQMEFQFGIVKVIILCLLLFQINVFANLGIKKLFSFGHRSVSDPSNGTQSPKKMPFRRANSLQQRPFGALPSGTKLSKPLMTTPLHAIELVNLLSMPDLYMDGAGVHSWTRIGTRHVARIRARADDIGTRIRRNIRHSVQDIGSQPVKELHDRAAFMAPDKSFDLCVLYSLLTLADYLCDQLLLVSDEMREQIEKHNGFVHKWFNKWPNVAEIDDFEQDLGERKHNLAKWATHLGDILNKAKVKVTPKKHLKELFYDSVKVKRIVKASDAKDFISVCDLAGDERMVKRKLQNADLTKQSESATLSLASWATKQTCKVQIGKKSGKMKGVNDLEGLDMQVCEGIKKGEDPNKIAEKMAPRLKKTVDEMDKSPSVQKEMKKISEEQMPSPFRPMPKGRRRAKRAIWGRKRKRRDKAKGSSRRERLNVGMRSFMKLRPFVSQYLSGRPGKLNARSPAARVRANRRNPRRQKRGSGGQFIKCTVLFLLALFFAINTISAFFAIFSPAFIVAFVATLVLGMITGVFTSGFMSSCAVPAQMGAHAGGGNYQGYGQRIPYAAPHVAEYSNGHSGGGNGGGHGFKMPKFGREHSAAATWGMSQPGYHGYHAAPPEVYLLEEEYELKRRRGFSSSASYSASSSSSDERSAGRSMERRRKYRKNRRIKSYRQKSYDNSSAETRVVQSEEEEVKTVRRRTVTKHSYRRQSDRK